MEETLVIAGLGRCGTSLAMQLLHAAGMPVVGEYPSFEGSFNSHFNIRQHNIDSAAGKAIKILDPHILAWERGIYFDNCKVVYMTRDLTEQAKSQIKMASMGLNIPADYSRRTVRGMKALLEKNNKQARKAFGHNPRMDWTFEGLIEQPEKFINAVAIFTHIDLNASVAGKTTRPRSTKCYNGFLELELLGAA